MNEDRFDELDAEMRDLERELEREMSDMPGSDREDAQRRPHVGYVILYSSDIEELADFYEGVFGFDRRYETGSTVELFAGSVILALTDERELMDTVGLDSMPRPFEGRSSHTVLVENVEQCFDAAIALGGQTIKEPYDTEWGMRSCWVRDPSGHLLEIGRHQRG